MQDDPTISLNATPSGSAEHPPQLEKWGDFQLVARVGRGGFGEVYRAWDPHLQREVALKLLLPGSIGGDEEYRALLREARALASVHHPNIVHVYGIDRHDGRVGFWTDFVYGKTLSALLAAQGSFGYREAALIGLDVARALSAVHRAGILHRDIKAENVMREEGGRILLMDFGLSTLPQAQSVLSGTPNYMAPELFEGGPATIATDIYAMGVLLYYLVAGEYPVRLTGRPLNEALSALRQRRPLIDLRPDLPESFLRTVNIATQLDPARRFATAGLLAEALAESLGVSVALEPSSMLAAGPQKPSRPKFLIGLVAVLAVLAVALLLGNPKRWFRSSPASDTAATAPAGTPADTYDEYQKSADLLQRSYKDANIAAAADGFQRVLDKDPSFALAAAGLGRAWFLQYRNNKDPQLLEKARAETMKAIQLDPNLAPPYVTLARMATMQGQTALAMQQAQKAVALDPHSAEAYGALAELAQADGRNQEALTALQHAIDLAPNDWHWPVLLGSYYFSHGDLKDAAEQFQKGADLDPQNAIAEFDLGLARQQLGQSDQALQDYRKVLAIQPDAYTYRALGTLLADQGKFADSIEMEKKAIATSPGDYEDWGNLAASYQWSGDKKDSIAAYRKAVLLAEEQRSRFPDNPAVLTALGDFYASLGEGAKTDVLLRKALALSPDDPSVEFRAGIAYEVAGQRSKAIPLIARALALGYNTSQFQRNPDLSSLRADPAFQSALKDAKSQTPVDKSSKLK